MSKERVVKVDYATTKMEIAVPSDAVLAQVKEDPPALPEPEKAIREALANPIGMENISQLVSKGSKVTIAFDAPPRSGLPRRKIIPILLEQLSAAGVSEKEVTLVCAGGTHAKISKEGLLDYLGPELFNRFWPDRLQNHDASQDLVYLGVSELGDYVEYNRLVAESDLLIYLGTIFPINWGGYTGTGVVIGLGSARSINSHHTEVIDHPDSCHGDQRTHLYRLHKEAIHKQIEKSIGKKILYVDTIVNSKGEISAVFAGHSPEINEPAWQAAETLYQVEVPQADVIIVGVPYKQVYGTSDNPILAMTYTVTAQRTWVNKPMLREGGVVIGLVKCSGIIDSDRPSDSEVLELFGRSFDTHDLSPYREEFLTRPDLLYKYRHCFCSHPAHPFWLFYENQYYLNHASKVIMAGEVNPGAVRKVGAVPARNFDQAWKMAKQVVGENPQVVILPNYWTWHKAQFVVK